MQSDGGLTPVSDFSGHKAILSGPAGGVIGYAITTYDEYDGMAVVGFDMGGTSTGTNGLRDVTAGYLRFGPMAQCVVHVLKGLACRARVTPASLPAVRGARLRFMRVPSRAR